MNWTREIERDFGIDNYTFELMAREANALAPYCHNATELAEAIADSMNRTDEWIDDHKDPDHPVWAIAIETWEATR